ncbi:MAG: c-type cytochrome biogenesis protein CcsB [Acidobacteria bacterium]|nr:c-type cytochrome biogenesis protein CcsB [Acidobacteriota bacterium]MBI3656444.1 c-type cytochrome biogenesis protein CcsB [Acidobacteriota bacterium]
MSPLILSTALLFYVLGLTSSVAGFVTKRQWAMTWAVGAVGIGFLLHTAFLITLWLLQRRFPVANLTEAFSFFSWAVTLSFFIVYFRYHINVLGAFVLPLVTAFLLLASLIWVDHRPLSPELQSYWVYLHTPIAFLSYAAFFVTFTAAVMYLLQSHELKTKRQSLIFYRLPSLAVCDDLINKSLSIGLVLMTLTIITGAFWADAKWGRFWGWDPKECMTLTTWLIYFALFHFRWAIGWRGRRTAYLSLFGFAAVLFTFLGAQYFTGLHKFN